MALGAKAAPNAATLKRAMLDLNDKGGTSAIASGVAYAKKEDNIASVRGVALRDNGHLLELDKMKASDKYTFQGRCFQIVQLGW